MPRLPVAVVAGFAGAGKTTLIGHWLRTRPAGERWALLANASAAEPPDALARRAEPSRAVARRPEPARAVAPRSRPALARAGGFYRVAGGCACCTAQASARSALIELLRAGPWDRLLVELDGAAHPAALVDLLRAPPFDRHLRIDTITAVIDAARPAPFADEPMHPLARAQVEVAARIVLNRAQSLPEPRRAALATRLANAPPFGRVVEIATDDDSEWILTHNKSCVFPEPLVPDDDGNGRAGGAGPVRLIEWRRPPEAVFDRSRVQALVRAWSGHPALLRGAGAIRTEREWYLWGFDGSGSVWQAGAYRLDNRLSLATAAGGPDTAGVRAALAAARIVPEK